VVEREWFGMRGSAARALSLGGTEAARGHALITSRAFLRSLWLRAIEAASIGCLYCLWLRAIEAASIGCLYCLWLRAIEAATPPASAQSTKRHSWQVQPKPHAPEERRRGRDAPFSPPQGASLGSPVREPYRAASPAAELAGSAHGIRWRRSGGGGASADGSAPAGGGGMPLASLPPRS
jgi:hypothetical protein